MTYVLYEWHNNPMFLPDYESFGSSFANKAFEWLGIEKPEDLFSLEIPYFKGSLVIEWKLECLKTPIFRYQVKDTICNSTPWTFADFN